MDRFVGTLILDCFVALGLVLGGSLVGGIGAVLTHRPPMATMLQLADQLKIWAMVSALGGTMDTIKVFETGVLEGQISLIIKQLGYLLAAFIGCQIGYFLVQALTGGPKP
ncbi:YtrH family sporulation protein [Fodinisporobacter ferrooxydans]|uniref:YtrH family sporulation protein n=1 Tax=Fodinisporobacter ferrooxydans TaxID=2901836 RepID=A0ABY4CM06_9BACL|nr:YtrH family sporulation protein [Alicyclobacillaceae bacterium MYW30-H2]